MGSESARVGWEHPINNDSIFGCTICDAAVDMRRWGHVC